MIIGIITAIVTNENMLTIEWAVGIGMAVLFSLVVYGEGLYQIEVIYSDLTAYIGELPYGALLAVKEARGREIKNFQVWYPTVAPRNHDPIITGLYKGVMVQVFAWNLGQLEE